MFMKVFSIYKVTNLLNNKVYIGFCSTSLEARRSKHIRVANLKTTSSVFHAALRKYKPDNFQWDILYQSTDGKYCLNVMEPFFIKEYNSFFENGQGYNMNYGGGGMLGYKQSEYQKARVSAANKGKFMSPSTRSLISKAHKGKTLSQWHKDRVSETQANVPYLVTDPNGNTNTILNMKKFCRENNLHARYMFKLANGSRTKPYKGWLCSKLPQQVLP